MKEVLFAIVLFFLSRRVVSECYESPEGDFCSSVDDLKSRNASVEIIELLADEKINLLDSSHLGNNHQKLKKLRISGAFQSLDVGIFDNLTNLEVLELENNTLSEIHNLHFQNGAIKQLILPNNEIKFIKRQAFSHLLSLLILNLKDNLLASISTGIFNNLSIHELSLRRNKLFYLQKNAFDGLNSLKHLDLAENRLKSFWSSELMGLGLGGSSYDLLKLDLSSNEIVDLDIKQFPKLLILDAAQNKISALPDGFFHGNPELVRVILSVNLLEELRPDVLPPEGVQILSFDITLNRLSFLEEEFLIRMPRLTHMSSCGNAWQCPCYDLLLKWFLEHDWIRNICNPQFTNGKLPVCIFREDYEGGCDYKTKLYEDFKGYVNASALGRLPEAIDSYIIQVISL